MSVNKLVDGRPRMNLAVAVNSAGQVLEHAGSGDVESFGAMTAMCNQAMDDAGSSLGLGDLIGWVAVTDDSSIYCARNDRAVFGGLTNASRNALGGLDAFITNATGSW